MDLTGDTATAADVAQGKTFHLASGAPATGTASGGGTSVQLEQLSVVSNGTYTADTGKAYSPVVVNVPSVDRGMLIDVTAPTGSTVTATRNGATYTGTESPAGSGQFTIEVPDYGTYAVTVTLGTDTLTKQVVVEEENVQFTVLLPEGYTPLEYLKSSGTQYLNIGLVSNDGHRWVGDVMFDSVAGDIRFLGCQSAAPYGRDDLGKWAAGIWICGTPDNAYSGNQPVLTDIKYHFDVCNLKNLQNITIDSTVLPLQVAAEGGGSVVGLDRYLFADNYNNEYAFVYLSGKLYGPLSVYESADDSALVSKLYPAQRESDGELGMYDVVRGQFFTNAGTGTFVAGPEV